MLHDREMEVEVEETTAKSPGALGATERERERERGGQKITLEKLQNLIGSCFSQIRKHAIKTRVCPTHHRSFKLPVPVGVCTKLVTYVRVSVDMLTFGMSPCGERGAGVSATYCVLSPQLHLVQSIRG